MLAHYAPRAKVRMMPSDLLLVALDAFELEVKENPVLLHDSRPRLAVYSRSLWAHRTSIPGVVHRAMPPEPVAAASGGLHGEACVRKAGQGAAQSRW